MKIKKFTQLDSWENAHKLVLAIYKLTKKFPDTENYALKSQMQRAAVSITSNIAEGFGRKTKKDKVHFYYQSLGSLYELQNQLLIARDLDYINTKESNKTAEQTVNVAKLINGSIRSLS